jgi:hypothetical protein
LIQNYLSDFENKLNKDFESIENIIENIINNDLNNINTN